MLIFYCYYDYIVQKKQYFVFKHIEYNFVFIYL